MSNIVLLLLILGGVVLFGLLAYIIWAAQGLLIMEKKTERDLWDKWYGTLPSDLRRKLSLHDFKRLGECFKEAFAFQEGIEVFDALHGKRER